MGLGAEMQVDFESVAVGQRCKEKEQNTLLFLVSKYMTIPFNHYMTVHYYDDCALRNI